MAIELLPHDEDFDRLSKEEQQIIIDADTTLVNLIKKKKGDNKRISAYIADKRKDNPNYARG